MNRLQRLLGLFALVLFVVSSTQGNAVAAAKELYVDPVNGNDQASGDASAPVLTLQGALYKLPAQVDENYTIYLAGGTHAQSGCQNPTLELNRLMNEDVVIRIVSQGAPAILDWPAPGKPMITATHGHWSLENVQVGTRQEDQRKGILAVGPAILDLHSVRIHTGSERSPGLRATRGGLINLYGTIELNEDLHENCGPGETFCRIEADYNGIVRFQEREKASLSIGNGSLCSGYYGVIELGCATARITSWHECANVIAVNNSGRVDLHNTEALLTARNPRNTPIGLEDDGHVLAEGAPVTIQGYDNSDAIVLQKASAFFCNDVTLRGTFKNALASMSGSTMLVGIIGDLNGGYATTGARIIVEKCTGNMIRPVEAQRGGVVILPEDIKSGPATTPSQPIAPPAPVAKATPPAAGSLPPICLAAQKGEMEGIGKLLTDGADVNQRGPDGRTALHWAAYGGHQETCGFLLSKGADINAKDKDGATPLDIAKARGHSQLSAFLTQRTQKK